MQWKSFLKLYFGGSKFNERRCHPVQQTSFGELVKGLSKESAAQIHKYTNPQIKHLMSIAIKVENLSKAYQLGEIGTGTLSRDASAELSMTAFRTLSSYRKQPELLKRIMQRSAGIQKQAELMSAGQNKNAGQGARLWGGSIFLFLTFCFFCVKTKERINTPQPLNINNE